MKVRAALSLFLAASAIAVLAPAALAMHAGLLMMGDGSATTVAPSPMIYRVQAEARNEQLVVPRFTSDTGGVALHLRRDGRLAQPFQPVATPASSSGFDWTLAGVIAGVILLLGAGAGAILVTQHRVPRTA